MKEKKRFKERKGEEKEAKEELSLNFTKHNNWSVRRKHLSPQGHCPY